MSYSKAEQLGPRTRRRRRSMSREPSARQAAKIARRVPARDAYLAQHPYCEAAREGAPGRCWGGLTVHEPWTKARGGPIDDPVNMRAVCSWHNTQISQHARTMGWAESLPYERLFLVSAAWGPTWLETRRRWLEAA